MENNIVVASFSGSRSAVTVNRYQYDYGQKLHVIGIPGLPSVFEVHFASVPSSGEAKIWVGQDGVVDIPDEYLATGTPVYAWIFLHTGEADGETVYSIKIPVVRRPRPVSDEPTPQQQSEIDTAIAALQAGVAKAEGFADDAEEQAGIAQNAANTATQAAEQAQGAVTSVEAAARRAEQSADAAGLSEGHARQYAVDSEDSAREAEAAKGAAETAQEKAETAQGKAKDAQEGAESAKDTAVEAKDDAVAAKGDAEQAKDDAVTAKNTAVSAKNDAVQAKDDSITAKNAAVQAQEKAEDAQEAAETAQGKAEEAQGKAEDAEATAEWYAERVERFLPTDTASGSIASFSDGADGAPMESVTVTMTPQQDLHGQDAPYPAGGGKNLLNNTLGSGSYGGFTYTSASDGSITFSGSTNAVFEKTIGSFALKGETPYKLNGNSFPTSNVRLQLKKVGVNTALVQAYNNGDATYTPPEDGDYIVTIAIVNETLSNFTIYPMIRLASVTDNTFAPYENVCPITGYDSGTVWGTGVNVWDEEWEIGGMNVDTGAVTTSSDRIRSKNYISVKPNAQYCFGYESTITSEIFIQILMYDADKTYLGRSAGYVAKYRGQAFSTAANCAYIMFGLSPQYGATYNHDISINYSSTDHDYHAYTGNSYPTTFPSTVYDGDWKVTEGEIASGWAIADLGDLTWTRNATYGFFQSGEFDIKKGASGSLSPVICEQYKTDNVKPLAQISEKDFAILQRNTYANVCVNDSRYSDAESFKSAVTGVKICYELAEPTTLTVDPLTIPSQLGANNVWSDCGDSNVVYRADVGLYIDKKIADAVSDL